MPVNLFLQLLSQLQNASAFCFAFLRVGQESLLRLIVAF